jgi:adenylosuccinate lyase
MKTDARSQTEPKTRIERMLDALRIQADNLHDLAVAVRTMDRNEPAVEAEDRSQTMSRP